MTRKSVDTRLQRFAVLVDDRYVDSAEGAHRAIMSCRSKRADDPATQLRRAGARVQSSVWRAFEALATEGV